MGKRNDDRSNSMNPNNPAYQASMKFFTKLGKKI